MTKPQVNVSFEKGLPKIDLVMSSDSGRSFGNNPSGIFPTEYKVLVSPIRVDEKTKGGIILPDEHKDREQFAQMQGVLVAISPLAFTYASKDDWGGAERPKPGDKVMFAKFAGAAVKGKDGADYRIINDKDVSAVLA